MRRLFCFAVLSALTLSSAALAQTATEIVIYNCNTGTTNAQNPYWRLVQASDGNYCGTSQYKGDSSDNDSTSPAVTITVE